MDDDAMNIDENSEESKFQKSKKQYKAKQTNDQTLSDENNDSGAEDDNVKKIKPKKGMKSYEEEKYADLQDDLELRAGGGDDGSDEEEMKKEAPQMIKEQKTQQKKKKPSYPKKKTNDSSNEKLKQTKLNFGSKGGQGGEALTGKKRMQPDGGNNDTLDD